MAERRLTRAGARRYLARMARREFGAKWLDAIRAFWRAWRALGLPEMDEAPAAQVLSSIGIVLGALSEAREHMGDRVAALRHARAALGMPPVGPVD